MKANCEPLKISILIIYTSSRSSKSRSARARGEGRVEGTRVAREAQTPPCGHNSVRSTASHLGHCRRAPRVHRSSASFQSHGRTKYMIFRFEFKFVSFPPTRCQVSKLEGLRAGLSVARQALRSVFRSTNCQPDNSDIGLYFEMSWFVCGK